MAEEIKLPFLQKKGKTSQLSIRLTEELRGQLEKLAQDNDVSLSYLISSLLENGITESLQIRHKAAFMNSLPGNYKDKFLGLETCLPVPYRQLTIATHAYPNVKLSESELEASLQRIMTHEGLSSREEYYNALDRALEDIRNASMSEGEAE